MRGPKSALYSLPIPACRSFSRFGAYLIFAVRFQAGQQELTGIIAFRIDKFPAGREPFGSSINLIQNPDLARRPRHGPLNRLDSRIFGKFDNGRQVGPSAASLDYFAGLRITIRNFRHRRFETHPFRVPSQTRPDNRRIICHLTDLNSGGLIRPIRKTAAISNSGKEKNYYVCLNNIFLNHKSVLSQLRILFKMRLFSILAF